MAEQMQPRQGRCPASSPCGLLRQEATRPHGPDHCCAHTLLNVIAIGMVTHFLGKVMGPHANPTSWDLVNIPIILRRHAIPTVNLENMTELVPETSEPLSVTDMDVSSVPCDPISTATMGQEAICRAHGEASKHKLPHR